MAIDVTVVTELPDLPSAASPAEPTPEPVETPEAATESAPSPEPVAVVDLGTILADKTAEEILSAHEPTRQLMHGRSGDLARRQAEQIFETRKPILEAQIRAQVAEEFRQRQEAAENAELERLRSADPLEFAERYGQVQKRRSDLAAQHEQEVKRAAGLSNAVKSIGQAAVQSAQEKLINPLAAELMEKLPDKARELHEPGRYHGRDPWEAMHEYATEARAALAQHAISQVDTRHKRELAALKKEALAAQNAGESPDLGGGAAVAGGKTVADYKAMPIAERLAWRRANPAAYTAMFSG